MSPQELNSAIPFEGLKDNLSRSNPLSETKDPIKLEYELWDRSHKSLKESPPSEGRDYLKHAKNLLNLLEGISEIHPIAKGEQCASRRKLLDFNLNVSKKKYAYYVSLATVVSFKAILLFEEDRRENDARVTAVFLAQTDMMRVLLESVQFNVLFSYI